MTILLDTSVAEFYRYIKEFTFVDTFGRKAQTDLTFSDVTKIMLDSRTRRVRLRRQDDGFYPLDENLWFRTWTTNPTALREILMIQVKSIEPTDTLTQVRVYDGIIDRYWDGAEWSEAGEADWNDEGTVNANLDSFPILPGRTFAITVNLQTTDRYETPLVKEVLALLQLHIDYIEDVVLRSLIPLLADNIRPVGNYPLPALEEEFDEIDLNDYKLDTPFDVTDVTAVFNFSTDPDMLYNLVDSYDVDTKIITLTTPIGAGEIPFILFKYKPEIIYTTHQDFYEVEKIPSLVLQRMEIPTSTAYSNQAKEAVVDKGTCDAVVLPAPVRLTIECRIHAYSDHATDEMRLMSALMKFFEENLALRAIGVDEWYRMQISREFRDLISPDRTDQRPFWTMFQIMDVKLPLVSIDAKGVRRTIIKLKEVAAPTEDPVLGGSRLVVRSHEDDGPFAWEETIEITE